MARAKAAAGATPPRLVAVKIAVPEDVAAVYAEAAKLSGVTMEQAMAVQIALAVVASRKRQV